MKYTLLLISFPCIALISACTSAKNHFDASGAFEAEEIIVSSQATGQILRLTVKEGQSLLAGQPVGVVDSLQLFLKKKQVDAQVKALLGRRPDIHLQLAALQEQLTAAEREQKRVANLVRSEAATTKQMDDINASIAVLRRQIDAQRSALVISSEGLNNDVEPLELQARQLQDQLEKCRLVNPVKGEVLATYAREGEMAVAGKPLYKVADLDWITLRVYISGNQLPQLKLNQPVEVFTDDGKGDFRQTQGTVTWISDKAEFTPKTIQTKDERANLVYATKVRVKNDGSYKIGMYGEIRFNHD